MTLTPDQFTAIDRHLRKENWLLNEDLITELTDHYADGIRERLTHGMSFEAAVQDIHRNFGGRKGLLKMEEEYQQSQKMQTARIRLNTMRSYFRVPRLGITLLILMVVYGLIRSLPANIDIDRANNWLSIIFLCVVTVLYIMALISLIMNQQRKSRKANTRNQELIAMVQVINLFFLVGFQIRLWMPVDEILIWYPLPSSVVVTLFVIAELAAIELFYTYSRTSQSLKPA